MQPGGLQVAQRQNGGGRPFGGERASRQQFAQGLQGLLPVDGRQLRQLGVLIEALGDGLLRLPLDTADVAAPAGAVQRCGKAAHPVRKGLLLRGCHFRFPCSQPFAAEAEEGRSEQSLPPFQGWRRQMLQQALRRTPDRLVGQGGAAGDVIGVRGVGELRLEGVADGVVGIRQVGQDDADAGVWVLPEHLPGPLGGGADFIGPAVELHAPLRLRRSARRLVAMDAGAGLFATG